MFLFLYIFYFRLERVLTLEFNFHVYKGMCMVLRAFFMLISYQPVHIIILVHMPCSAKINACFLSCVAFMYFFVSAYIKAQKSSQLSSLIFPRNVWKLWKVCDGLNLVVFVTSHLKSEITFFIVLPLKKLVWNRNRIRRSWKEYL